MSDASLRAAAQEDGGTGPIGRLVGLVLGPALVVGLHLAGPPQHLSPQAWIVVSLLALMLVWWVTEAIPAAATALLPLFVLPLAGVVPAAEAAAPYADPILFLFIGGFMIARAIELWDLHARVALSVAAAVGARPAALVGGFILAAALLSMWISNTATALMLVPIAAAVARAMAAHGHDDPKLGAALILGVAYAASIGGMGTPVGSPTNVIAMGFLADQGLTLSFLQWMALGVPVMALTLPALWLLTASGLKRASADDAARGRQVLGEARAALGPVSKAETRVGLVFLAVAVCWITRELVLTRLPGLERLTDTAIALAGALALFLLPSGAGEGRPKRLLDWNTAERIPWGIVLLFGGGLSVAGAMEATGLSEWLAGELQALRAYELLAVIAALIVVTLIATELMSNVATLTAMLPIVLALATALQVPPLYLVFPVSIAASLGFMLPIATAPNAIAYATGYPSLKRMLVIGGLLNVAGVGAILAVNALFAPAVLG